MLPWGNRPWLTMKSRYLQVWSLVLIDYTWVNHRPFKTQCMGRLRGTILCTEWIYGRRWYKDTGSEEQNIDRPKVYIKAGLGPPSTELRKPPIPYRRGWKFTAFTHIPDNPTRVYAYCLHSIRTIMVERHQLSPLQCCQRYTDSLKLEMR
jgi:hypothetical protein